MRVGLAAGYEKSYIRIKAYGIQCCYDVIAYECVGKRQHCIYSVLGWTTVSSVKREI